MENSSAGSASALRSDMLKVPRDLVDAQKQSQNSIDLIGPAPPAPIMAALKGKSTEEILADLNKSPLFMTNLEENDDLEALKALAYEGTPLEVGLNFKERGNECFKEGKWADGKEFYAKGIQVLQVEQRKRVAEEKETGVHKPADEETKEELVILEACLVNRAACHLSLKNYRSCTLDCGAALRLNPKNIKAYYRSSKALLALQKIDEADEVCSRGLALEPSNAALKAVADQIIAKNVEIQAKNAKIKNQTYDEFNKAFVLRQVLKQREIVTRKTEQPPELEDAKVQLVPDPSDPKSTLVFPTVFLYPLHLQSDFVKAFNSTELLGSRLDDVLSEPAPWDQEREYTSKKVYCFMETVTGGLVKLGRNVTLLKALGGGKVEVVDDVVKIFVVPKTKAEHWIADFKMKKAGKGTG